jgi:hypothetical protein
MLEAGTWETNNPLILRGMVSFVAKEKIQSATEKKYLDLVYSSRNQGVV